MNFCGVLLFSVSSAGVRFLLLFPMPFSVVAFDNLKFLTFLVYVFSNFRCNILFFWWVFVCVFFSHGASYNFLVGYSLSLGRIMSLDKLESFPIRFTGKNYSAWEFQFKLFVKRKELWGHIDGSVPAPQGAEALSK